MATTTINGYNINSNGDVENGLQYLRDYWNTQQVIDIFRDCRDMPKGVGHEFELRGSRYTLFHDGDYEYFLKAR